MSRFAPSWPRAPLRSRQRKARHRRFRTAVWNIARGPRSTANCRDCPRSDGGGWIGWRVPIADGLRGGCCTYGDDSVSVRGCAWRAAVTISARGRTQVAGPVSLEAGTGLVVLPGSRKAVSNGCERWATTVPSTRMAERCTGCRGVTPAESARFLDSSRNRAPVVLRRLAAAGCGARRHRAAS